MPPHIPSHVSDSDSEARFRHAIEEAPIPVILHAEDGEVLAISRVWSEITGYSKDDIPTIAAWAALAYGEHKDTVLADIEGLYGLTRRRDEGEYTIRCADGSPRVWDFSSVGLGRFPDGRRVALSMAHDVTDRKRAQQRAEAALAQLAKVFERVTDAFVALDRDWRYTYVNQRAGEIFGRRPEDLIGKHIWTEFPEGVGQPFHRMYLRAMAEQTPIHFEDYYAPYDRWFENIVYPSPDGLSIYFHDITDRKRAELALLRSHRALQTLSGCNEALVRAATEDELLRAVCGLIVARGGYRMCWIGYPENDAARTVRKVASAGPADSYLAEKSVSWAADARGRGPTGTAIREGRLVVAQDLRSHPEFGPWREAALAHGFAASIALPLLHADGTCFGALSIYAGEPLAFDAEERRLMTELANDLAYGIGALRDRAARVAAEARYRRAIDGANEGVWEWNPETGENFLSPRWKKLLGYEDHELPDREESFFGLLHPDDRERVAQAVRAHFEQRRPYEVEVRMRHKSGAYRWIYTRGQATWDEHGKPRLMAGSITDITERRRAEDERRAALERFETLFRGAPEAMSISEFETGRFLQVNDAFCALFGFAREDLIGRTSLELNLWTGPQRRPQLVAELRAGRRVVAEEGQVRTRSGAPRDTRFSAERIDFGGTPCLLMMFVDVTEQLHAQRQVEAHERQLADLARRLMSKEEEERKALAQTLHDRFAQNLAAAKLGVEGVLLQADAAADGPRKLQATLRGVIASLDDAIADVRGVLTELRPPLLNEFGLRAALRHEIDSRRGRHPAIALELAPAAGAAEAWPPQRLPAAAEFALFHIAREALSNALLHAAARRVEVALDIDAQRAIVTVRDDGNGFDAREPQAYGHLGLTGMRERAALIGATLDIDSAPCRGTTVTVTCPVAAPSG